MFNVNVKNATSEKLSDAYKVTRISVLCCISAVLEQMSNKSLFFKPKRPHHQESEGFWIVQFDSYFEQSRRSVTTSFQVSKLEKAPATFLFSGLFVWLRLLLPPPPPPPPHHHHHWPQLALININYHQLCGAANQTLLTHFIRGKIPCIHIYWSGSILTRN